MGTVTDYDFLIERHIGIGAFSFEKIADEVMGNDSFRTREFRHYHDLLKRDPYQGIERLDELIAASMRIKNPLPRFMHSTLSQEDMATQLLKISGRIYPITPIDFRIKLLKKCIDTLEHFPPECASRYIAKIDEPLLAGDLAFNRPALMPALDYELGLVEPYEPWKTLREKLGRSRGDFLMGYAVMHYRKSSLNSRANFYLLFPDFTNRTLDAIAAITARNAKDLSDETSLRHELRHIDPLLQPAILEKIASENWIMLEPVPHVIGKLSAKALKSSDVSHHIS